MRFPAGGWIPLETPRRKDGSSNCRRGKVAPTAYTAVLGMTGNCPMTSKSYYDWRMTMRVFYFEPYDENDSQREGWYIEQGDAPMDCGPFDSKSEATAEMNRLSSLVESPTAGPWVWSDGSSGTMLLRDPGDDDQVELVLQAQRGGWHAPSPPDARLIAAAPELYEAAKNAYALTTRLDGLSPDDASDVETARKGLLRAMRAAGFGERHD